MAIVIKTQKSGRQYYYDQQSVRIPGRKNPYSKMKYLGPVRPKRRKGLLGQILAGGISMGVHAAKGSLGPPGGKKYPDKHRPPDPRSQVHEHNRFVDLVERDPKAAIADVQARARVSAARATPPAPMSDDMKAFSDRLASGRAVDGGRVVDAAPAEPPAAPDAPGEPGAPGEGASKG